MYKTLEVFVRSHHPHWTQIDFENRTVSEVLQDNLNILIVFVNIEYSDEVKHIDISNERHWMRFENVSFDTLINEHDIQDLIQDGALTLFEQSVLSGELDVLNFDYQLSSVGYNLESRIPDSMKNDLYVTRENTDIVQLSKQSIFTVNGLCHPSNLNGDGITVRGAGETLRHSGKDSLGLISFRALGNIEQYNIGVDRLPDTVPESGLYKDLVLNFPETDLTNVTPFLVWCGKLLLPGQGWDLLGPHAIRIHPNKIGWVETIHELKDWLKLDSLTLNEYSYNSSLVSKTQLKEDLTIRRALELKQTFLFVLDVGGVEIVEHPIDYDTPGRFITTKKKDYPLRLHDGRYPSYMKHDEDVYRALTIPFSPRLNYKHDSWYGNQIDLMDDTLDVQQPEYKPTATLIEISRKTPMTKKQIENEKRRTGVITDASTVVPDTTECEDNYDYILTSIENALTVAKDNFTREDD